MIRVSCEYKLSVEILLVARGVISGLLLLELVPVHCVVRVYSRGRQNS